MMDAARHHSLSCILFIFFVSCIVAINYLGTMLHDSIAIESSDTSNIVGPVSTSGRPLNAPVFSADSSATMLETRAARVRVLDIGQADTAIASLEPLSIPLELSYVHPSPQKPHDESAVSPVPAPVFGTLSDRQSVQIVFNRAVIAVDTAALVSDKAPQGIELHCAGADAHAHEVRSGHIPHGIWRWTSTVAVRFEPHSAWPPGLRCALQLHASLQTYDSVTLGSLDKWPRKGLFEFVTSDLSWRFGDIHSPIAEALTGKRWNAWTQTQFVSPLLSLPNSLFAPEFPPDAVFQLLFSHNISVASVSKSLSIRQVSLTAAEDDKTTKLRPVGPLKLLAPLSNIQACESQDDTIAHASHCIRVSLDPRMSPLLLVAGQSFELVFPAHSHLYDIFSDHEEPVAQGALRHELALRFDSLRSFRVPFAQRTVPSPSAAPTSNAVLRVEHNRMRMLLLHGLQWPAAELPAPAPVVSLLEEDSDSTAASSLSTHENVDRGAHAAAAKAPLTPGLGLLPMFNAESDETTMAGNTVGGLQIPSPASLGQVSWDAALMSTHVRATLKALQTCVHITPAVPFTLDLISRSELDLVADMVPDTIYRININACPSVLDGFGQSLQPSVVVIRTQPAVTFLSAPGIIDSQQYLPSSDVKLIAFSRGQSKLGDWIPASSPWRSSHQGALNTPQAVIVSSISPTSIESALMSFYSPHHSFLAPDGANTSLAHQYMPLRCVASDCQISTEKGQQRLSSGASSLRRTTLRAPTSAFLVEKWESLMWIDNGPQARKSTALVSISDLSASVISFGNSLTVWVTKANKPFSMKKDELVVDAQFWGVCDTFVKPKLTDVKLLLTHTTSRQGLWRVPLASLRFHCTDAGTQRLTLIVKDRVTGQLLIVPVRVPVLLAPPLPGNPESSPTSKFGPNGVPLASVAERSLRDVGTILVDSPAVKIGQRIDVKIYARVQDVSLNLALPPVSFRYRLRMVFVRDASHSSSPPPSASAVFPRRSTSTVVLGRSSNQQAVRVIELDAPSERFGAMSTSIQIGDEIQRGSMIQLHLQRVVQYIDQTPWHDLGMMPRNNFFGVSPRSPVRTQIIEISDAAIGVAVVDDGALSSASALKLTFQPPRSTTASSTPVTSTLAHGPASAAAVTQSVHEFQPGGQFHVRTAALTSDAISSPVHISWAVHATSAVQQPSLSPNEAFSSDAPDNRLPWMRRVLGDGPTGYSATSGMWSRSMSSASLCAAFDSHDYEHHKPKGKMASASAKGNVGPSGSANFHEALTGSLDVHTNRHGVASFAVNFERPLWLHEGLLEVNATWVTPSQAVISKSIHLHVPSRESAYALHVLRTSRLPLPGLDFHINALLADEHGNAPHEQIDVRVALIPLDDDATSQLCQRGPPKTVAEWQTFLEEHPDIKEESSCSVKSLPAGLVHAHFGVHNSASHHNSAQVQGAESDASVAVSAASVISLDHRLSCAFRPKRAIRYLLMATSTNKHVEPWVSVIGRSTQQWATDGLTSLEPLHPFQEQHEVEHGHQAHIALFSPYSGVSMLVQWGDGLNDNSRPRPLQLQLIPAMRSGITRVPITVTAAECSRGCQAVVVLHIPPQPHLLDHLVSGIRVSPLLDLSMARSQHRVFHIRIKARPSLELSLELKDKPTILLPNSHARLMLQVHDPAPVHRHETHELSEEQHALKKQQQQNSPFEVSVWAIDSAWMESNEDNADNSDQVLNRLQTSMRVHVNLPRVQVQDSRDTLRSVAVEQASSDIIWRRLQHDAWLRTPGGGMLDTSVALSDSDYFRRMKTLITHMPAHMQSHYPAFLSRWINSVAPDLKLHTDVHLGGGRAFFIANSTTDKQGKTEIDFTVPSDLRSGTLRFFAVVSGAAPSFADQSRSLSASHHIAHGTDRDAASRFGTAALSIAVPRPFQAVAVYPRGPVHAQDLFQIGARVSLLDSVNGAADKAEVKLQFSRKHFSPPANEDASDDLDGSTRLQSDDAELLAHVDLTTNDPERSVLFILRAQHVNLDAPVNIVVRSASSQHQQILSFHVRIRPETEPRVTLFSVSPPVTVDRIKLPSGVDGTVQLTVGSGADHSASLASFAQILREQIPADSSTSSTLLIDSERALSLLPLYYLQHANNETDRTLPSLNALVNTLVHSTDRFDCLSATVSSTACDMPLTLKAIGLVEELLNHPQWAPPPVSRLQTRFRGVHSVYFKPRKSSSDSDEAKPTEQPESRSKDPRDLPAQLLPADAAPDADTASTSRRLLAVGPLSTHHRWVPPTFKTWHPPKATSAPSTGSAAKTPLASVTKSKSDSTQASTASERQADWSAQDRVALKRLHVTCLRWIEGVVQSLIHTASQPHAGAKPWSQTHFDLLVDASFSLRGHLSTSAARLKASAATLSQISLTRLIYGSNYSSVAQSIPKSDAFNGNDVSDVDQLAQFLSISPVDMSTLSTRAVSTLTLMMLRSSHSHTRRGSSIADRNEGRVRGRGMTAVRKVTAAMGLNDPVAERYFSRSRLALKAARMFVTELRDRLHSSSTATVSTFLMRGCGCGLGPDQLSQAIPATLSDHALALSAFVHANAHGMLSHGSERGDELVNTIAHYVSGVWPDNSSSAVLLNAHETEPLDAAWALWSLMQHDRYQSNHIASTPSAVATKATIALVSGERRVVVWSSPISKRIQTVSFSLPELEAKISPDATLEFSVDGAASIAVLMKHWPTVRHIEPAVSHGIQVELALHAAQAVSSDNLDSISLNSVSVGECATNARHLWQMSTAVQRARVGQVLLVTVQATTAVDLSSLRLSCSLPGGIRTLDAASSLTEQRIVSPSCLADDRSRSNHVEPHFRRVIDLERVRFVSLPSSLVTAGTNSFTFAVLAEASGAFDAGFECEAFGEVASSMQAPLLYGRAATKIDQKHRFVIEAGSDSQD